MVNDATRWQQRQRWLKFRYCGETCVLLSLYVLFRLLSVSVSTLPSTSHRRRILHLRYGFELRLLLFSSSLLLSPLFLRTFFLFSFTVRLRSRKWRHLGSRLTIELSVISLFSVSYPWYTHTHTNAHTHAGFTHRHTSVTHFASLRYPLSFTVQHLIAKN